MMISLVTMRMLKWTCVLALSFLWLSCYDSGMTNEPYTPMTWPWGYCDEGHPHCYSDLALALQERDSVQSIGLFELHLENSSLFSDSMMAFRSLEALSLRMCFISSFPDNVYNLTKLKYFEVLRTHGFTHLSDSVVKLTSLRELRLSNIDSVVLSDSIGSLSSLEVVYLVNLGLSSFPTSVTRLPKLRRLDLTGNRIMDVPDSISALKHTLQTLDLSNNLVPDVVFEKLKLLLPNTKIYWKRGLIYE